MGTSKRLAILAGTTVLLGVLFFSSETSSSSLLRPIRTHAPSDRHFPTSHELKNFAPIPPHFAQCANITSGAGVPTNAFWMNLITTHREEEIKSIWTNPYRVKIQHLSSRAHLGLHMSYPYAHRVFGGQSHNGQMKEHYAHQQITDLVLSALEFESPRVAPTFHVTSYSLNAVQVAFVLPTGETMTSPLVSGMAFISAAYSRTLTPVLTSPEARFAGVGRVFTIEGKTQQPPGLVVALEGKVDRWIVYPELDSSRGDRATATVHAHTLVFSQNVARLRVIRLPDQEQQPAALSSSQYEELIRPYATCMVTDMILHVPSNARYGFEWKTAGAKCDDALATSGILHYALDHQLQSLDFSHASRTTPVTALNLYSATRGLMAAIVTRGSGTSPTGPQWWFHESELEFPMDFYPPNEVSRKLMLEFDLTAKLEHEILEDVWQYDSVAGSYYFTGKKAQMYAELCIMAQDRNIRASSKAKAVCLKKLKQLFIDTLLSNRQKHHHPLVYDAVFGGIITSQTFHSRKLWADFGNAMYNDHHYHYGYWITAAAILRHLDPEWKYMPLLEEIISTLLRDVVNPNAQEDRYFPEFRYFDWFAGHSYSHGIHAMADGKDQESTSEETNFFYGMYLWAKVSHERSLENLAHLMMKLNRRAIQTYFLIERESVIHPPSFRDNRVTGIFFDNKVHYGTWFSPERHCIHGIQMIPISPATRLVRTPKFVQEEWEDVIQHLPIVAQEDYPANPWQSLLYTNYATLNPRQALEKLQYVPMDDGLSRAWAMYMAASYED